MQDALFTCLAIWVMTAGILLFSQWRRRSTSAGIVFGYLVNFWLMHWPAAILYLLPWYSNLDSGVVYLGFLQSTYGFVAFAIGVLVLAPVVARNAAFLPRVGGVRRPDERLPLTYIAVGVASYAALQSFAGVPTVTALVSAGWNLVIVGVCLGVWNGYRRRNQGAMVAWMCAALALPFVTLIMQGFLGYGTAALLTVMAFTVGFSRPRLALIPLALCFAYLALSFYVSYMRDRTEIRVMVRGGEPLVERVEKVAKTLKTIELFDPFNRQHLLRIDDRMNQNFLVGSAMQYIDAGLQPFARGATLSQALVALVPRALWPDKTVYAGSMGLVSNYTGITFAYGTSVGMGQVFEFYVNFGTTGIILGFLILGAALGVVDQAARDRLENGNWLAFTLWYLPGIAFLQAGGSLIEISSGGGAAVVTALLVNRGLLWGMRGKRMTDPLGRSVVGRA